MRPCARGVTVAETPARGKMPFMARCKRCNYVVWANTRAMLDELITLHNDISHNYCLDIDDFTVVRISADQKRVLDANAHNATFWNAFNASRKLKT